jgi:hypothetical protein
MQRLMALLTLLANRSDALTASITSALEGRLLPQLRRRLQMKPVMTYVKAPLPRVLALGLIGVVGVISLVAFQATSRAEARRNTMAISAVQAAGPSNPIVGPLWTPEVVTTPGLPLQCADGSWTRSIIRGGCAKHGGIGP